MTDKLREAAQQAPMAYYALVIKADSGYESTTEGRCTADQYGAAMAALHGTASLEQQDAQAVPQEYSGVRCMCVLTGCRAGPGCPRYNSHCRAHINHVNAAPTPPAQLPEARQWTGLTDIGVYFAITAAGKPPNPMSEEFFAWCEKFADAIEANLKERNT